MLNITGRQRERNGDAETGQPLLGQGHDRLADDPVIFSVTDDDEEEHSALRNENGFSDEPPQYQPKRSVRFQEEVRVIGPPLRSTLQSREAREQCLAMLPSLSC
jgi:sodium-coupled neutral amino acid transporter 11